MAGARPPQGHDIIVIGASAGGLEPLVQLLSGLPADLPAAIFIVLHLGTTSLLTDILSCRTTWPVHAAMSGTRIEHGHVYVAVPDQHLLMDDHQILVRRGPRENRSRPAIDPLFRSAACSFATRVIGVLLSGNLNDGTAGLRAIKACGGIAVVQQPADAYVPEMPRSALRHVAVDHVVAVREMPVLLDRLTRQVAAPAPAIPFEIRLETAIAAQEPAGMQTNESLGTLSPFACPECHGVLWQIDDGSMLRYRCPTGHAYTAESIQSEQERRAQELLWSLLRTHEERAALARRMAAGERAVQRDQLANSLGQRADGYEEDARTIRRLLQEVRAEQPAGGGDKQ